MEVGKNYVFYNNEFTVYKEDEDKAMVGTLLGEAGPGIYAFQVINTNFTRYSSNIHDELKTLNVNDFIENVSEIFQNTFLRNVSMIHNNYEFKVIVPRFIGEYININAIEESINATLEDYWSCLLEEINHSIQIKSTSIELTFRVHDVHELQFKYFDEVKA